MIAKTTGVLTSHFAAIMALSLFFSSCAPGRASEPATAIPSTMVPTVIIPTDTLPPLPTPTQTATPAPTPFPALTFPPGSSYFRISEQPAFILSRNLTGKDQADFDAVLDWAHQAGSKVIRVHLTHGWWGDPWINKDWSVNQNWARKWDGFFDQAQADGISIIPVFGVWADWNNGTPDWGSPLWQYNPLNAANGGLVSAPGDLFKSSSATQEYWMGWMKTLVERWQSRENIAAWEIFSEINIASGTPGGTDAKGGVDEASGVDFTDRAMAIIHAADARHRPVTLSLAGVYSPSDQWAGYYQLDSLDFIEIHPYSDQLDREIVAEVRQNRARYQKPVMIGESGLWSMTHNANAHIGIEHAIWAGLVSGSMNGRALWDNDGYAIYSISSRADAMAFMQAYAATELPVVNFTGGVDFSAFEPLPSTFSSGVWGAAVGSEKMVLGWYRDATCEPPDWNLRPVVSGQTVTITVPGTAARWKIDFYDARTGTDLLLSTIVPRNGGTVSINLPDFTDGVAFKMVVQE